jgi:hypothetical protein
VLPPARTLSADSTLAIVRAMVERNLAAPQS